MAGLITKPLIVFSLMKFRLLSYILLFSLLANAQSPDREYFRSPVDIPILLSGNFGELRSNHFHSGIDIKTQGKTGLPVYAAAEGDISRLRVSPYGFGLAIYIDHPNGQSTVYGHLLSFREDIEKYIKEKQYAKESFSVDLQIPEGTFPVKKGELIALSGNSGSSGGPHLHFEIRDTHKQEPLNPLQFGFPVKDDMKPKILSAFIAPLGNESHVNGQRKGKLIETVFYNGAYHLKGNPVIPVYGQVGFGIQALDYLDGSWNKCGVFEIKLKVDDQLVYTFLMDRLNFSETRYLNSHIDYSEYRKNYRRVHKSWVDPGNKLSNYHQLVNRGIVDLSDGKQHQIRYEIQDVYGNTSVLSFRVQSKLMQLSEPTLAGKLIRYNQEERIETDQLNADFPSGTFYSDFHLDYDAKPANNLYYSPLFKLHDDRTPVHQSYQLKLKADLVPDSLEDKALIAAISDKSGKKWSLGGKYENGWVTASVRQLGTFAISVDTIAPTIRPLSIAAHSRLTEKNRIRFKIRDEFSGIADYRGEIDGQWVLFEYDAKNALITYHIDSKRLQLNKKHQLKLEVTDNKGNVATYEANFFR